MRWTWRWKSFPFDRLSRMYDVTQLNYTDSKERLLSLVSAKKRAIFSHLMSTILCSCVWFTAKLACPTWPCGRRSRSGHDGSGGGAKAPRQANSVNKGSTATHPQRVHNAVYKGGRHPTRAMWPKSKEGRLRNTSGLTTPQLQRRSTKHSSSSNLRGEATYHEIPSWRIHPTGNVLRLRSMTQCGVLNWLIPLAED